jgi:tripartite-type tricarboxylate transporter receptor subunit TctC
MKTLMSKFLMAIVAVTVATGTVAQEKVRPFEPTKRPIEIVVSAPAGGALDAVARVASKIFEKNGWQAVIVNKPGADESLGAKYTSQQPADGHTLLIGSPAAMAANMVKPVAGSTYKYEEFDHIALMTSTSLMLATNEFTGVKNYSQYEKWVKANPEKYNLGTWVTFTSIVMQDIGRKEGLPHPVTAMFKGSPPMLVNLMGGHINFVVDTYMKLEPHIKTGKAVPLAVFDNGAANILPPELKNLRVITKTYPEYQMYAWIGLNCRAGTDPKIIAQMNKMINAGLQDPQFRKTVETQGFRVHGDKTPREYKQLNDQAFDFMRLVFSKPYQEMVERD